MISHIKQLAVRGVHGEITVYFAQDFKRLKYSWEPIGEWTITAGKGWLKVNTERIKIAAENPCKCRRWKRFKKAVELAQRQAEGLKEEKDAVWELCQWVNKKEWIGTAHNLRYQEEEALTATDCDLAELN